MPTRDQIRTYQKALETSDVIHEANSAFDRMSVLAAEGSTNLFL